MKKKIVLAIVLLVLFSPWIECAVDAFTLRFITPPEEVLQRFYTEQDLAEDELKDVLILAGAKMVPLLEREIGNKAIKRRAYAIGALGLIGTDQSIPVLKQILEDKNENEGYRGAALVAIARIDIDYGKKIARKYEDENNSVARRAGEILRGDLDPGGNRDYRRTYWEAFRHAHY